MSDIQVPVAFGKPNSTAVSTTGLPAGTLILNTDPVNTVWISPESAMQSGYGIPIGPKGSVSWADDNKPCYAILDTAATATVTLLVTQTLTDLNDPVAIGAAVATKLLATGVPTVLKQDLLLSAPGIFTIAPGQQSLIQNAGSYATLILQLNSSTSPGAILCEFDENTPFGALDYTYLEWLTNPGTSGGVPATWAIPVNFQSVRITNTGANPINLIVYGSNRMVVNAITQLGESSLTRKFGYNGTLTPGTPAVLASVDQNTRAFSRFNRSVFIRAAVSGGAAGLLGYRYVQQDGTTAESYVASLSAGANVFETIGHPIVPVSWVFLQGGSTSTSGGVSLDIGDSG